MPGRVAVSILGIALLLGVGQAKASGSEVRYFPSGSLAAGSARSDAFRNAWYSSHLQAMGEPVLHPGDGTRRYRFTWLRTFHHPVAVRIESSGHRARLIAVELDGQGGYQPGHVLRREERQLSPAQIAAVEAMLDGNGFWGLPASEETLGLDGSEWIIEGATDRYHVVRRWTPGAGPVRALGEYILSLAGWRFEPREFY